MNNKDEKALVAISCITYNHKDYLRDCLEGFIMQKTNFRYVAVVHDDCSTDGTTDILRDYAAKYPDIIWPIYEEENQYSKHDGSVGRIINKAIAATGCKYIAICEGDDYWTDPLKLQKQVDFLEEHEEHVMCFHAAEIKNEAGTKELITCKEIENKEYFTNDIFPGWVIPTASVVYRREMVEKYPPLKHQEWMKFGDIVLFLKCTHTGRVWGMSEKMSVYRMTEGGAVISQKNEKDYKDRICRHYQFLMENFPLLDKTWPSNYIATWYYTKFRSGKKLNDLWVATKYAPVYVMKKLLGIKVDGTY